MAYYSGIIEHDTGVHADAEQTALGQPMLMVEITIAEYRNLIKENAEAAYKLGKKENEITAYKQKLYDALKVLDTDNKLTATQKEDFHALVKDWQVKK